MTAKYPYPRGLRVVHQGDQLLELFLRLRFPCPIRSIIEQIFFHWRRKLICGLRVKKRQMEGILIWSEKLRWTFNPASTLNPLQQIFMNNKQAGFVLL